MPVFFYLMATESTEEHGKIICNVFILYVYFRGFRGNSIFLYRLERVLIAPVHLGNVVGQFDLLKIHVPQYPMYSADNRAHDLVNEIRVLLQ